MNYERRREEDMMRGGRYRDQAVGWTGGEFEPDTIEHIPDQAHQWARWEHLGEGFKVRRAVRFARRWKTWPLRGSERVALAAAYQHLQRFPDAEEYDVAKAAIRAATAAARRLEQ